jgi:DNA-binding response OmpR family regulator
MDGRILLVDSNPVVLEIVSRLLTSAGFEVLPVTEPRQALAIARMRRPRVVVLGLPADEIDARVLLLSLRPVASCPLVALVDEVGDARCLAFEIGAQGVMARPPASRELVARIRALLRSGEPRPGLDHDRPGLVQAGNLALDPLGRRVWRGQEPLSFKPREFDLLLFLAASPGRVYRREEILASVWGHEFRGHDRTVDVHVRWLREKVEDDPAQPVSIRTVRGVGYLFAGGHEHARSRETA